MRAFVGCAVLGGVLFVGCGDDAANPVKGAGGDGADAGAPSPGAGQGNPSNAGANVGGSDGSSGGESVALGGEASGDAGATSGDPLPLFASGTRLRAVVESAGDADSWIGWHDSELDLDCAFRPASDGEMRCLPKAFLAAFSDDHCQSGLVYVPDECDVPAFVSASSAACGDTLEAYEVGPVVVPLKTYIRSGATCEEVTFGASPLHSATLAPLADFVSAKSVLDEKSAELGVSYWQASDGAIQPVSVNNLAREQDCASTPNGDYSGRCVPTGTAYVSAGTHFYSDEDCTELVAHQFGCPGVLPTAVTRFDYGPDACAPVINNTYYEVGAAIAGGFQGVGNDCLAPGSQPHMYEIGALIAPESLPELGTVDLGSGRLKARYSSTVADEPLLFKQFYDSELDVICSAQPTVAHGLRCMPTGSIYSLYQDDACEELVVSVPKPQGNCQQQQPPKYFLAVDYPANTCDSTTPLRTYKSGAATTITDSLYQKSAGGCSASGADPNSSLWFSSTEIPAEDLVEILRASE